MNRRTFLPHAGTRLGRAPAGAVLLALLLSVAAPALPVAADHCYEVGDTSPSWDCHMVTEQLFPDAVYVDPGTTLPAVDPIYEDEIVEQAPIYLVYDSDGDGLSDGDEVNAYGTDPYNPDTDYDGWGDYLEIFGCIGDGIPGDPFISSIVPPCLN